MKKFFYLEDFEWKIMVDGKPYGSVVRIDKETSEEDLDEVLKIISQQIKKTIESK